MAKITAILALTVLALAGCASPEPLPTPTVTSAADCDQATATITWSPAQQPIYQPVGVQVVTYAAGQSTVEVTAFDSEPQVSAEGIDAEEWRETLLDSLSRTGQVDENFGAPAQIPDTPVGEPTPPVDGQFVVSVEAPLVTIPFEVDCNGVTATGLVSASSGGQSYTLLSCADPVAEDATPAEIAALEYCDPA